jgi:hypothetical protein
MSKELQLKDNGDIIKKCLGVDHYIELSSLIEDVQGRSDKIGAGYSKFQIENFIISSQLTPARQYKQILLELSVRFDSLKKLFSEYELSKIDLEEMQYKLEQEDTCQFEKKRLQVKIAFAKDAERNFNRQIQGVLEEINIFRENLNKFPDNITQDDIEKGEELYFRIKLSREAEMQGAFLSMMHMLEDKPKYDAVFSYPKHSAEIPKIAEKEHV